MGYRIEYDGRAGKYEVKREGKWGIPILLCTAIVLAFLCFLPQGRGELCGFLIPGEDEITLQAFENMTCDLRSGASLGEAVEAFCRFLIHGQ